MACVVRRCTLPKGQGERTTRATRTARATLEPAGAERRVVSHPVQPAAGDAPGVAGRQECRSRLDPMRPGRGSSRARPTATACCLRAEGARSTRPPDVRRARRDPPSRSLGRGCGVERSWSCLPRERARLPAPPGTWRRLHVGDSGLRAARGRTLGGSGASKRVANATSGTWSSRRGTRRTWRCAASSATGSSLTCGCRS